MRQSDRESQIHINKKLNHNQTSIRPLISLKFQAFRKITFKGAPFYVPLINVIVIWLVSWLEETVLLVFSLQYIHRRRNSSCTFHLFINFQQLILPLCTQ